MLSNTLNTNEIKNAAGVEVEFQHLEGEGRSRTFSQIAETYSLPHRLKISHLETGKGLNQRRRSVVRFDKTIISPVDTVTPVTISAYIVADLPVGAMTTQAEAANVVAELLSFSASLGATSTILFDGTGNGATCLLSGSL